MAFHSYVEKKSVSIKFYEVNGEFFLTEAKQEDGSIEFTMSYFEEKFLKFDMSEAEKKSRKSFDISFRRA